MTVYYCDVCGKRLYKDDAQVHRIIISDPKEHQEKKMDVCPNCIDRFWCGLLLANPEGE